jgi:2-polyprenyl-6-methoxyphenol hydroxylase-like FAD-dependent oxidoreductase
MLVISPVSGRARRRFLPGFVLLGDAAGFTDPITGGGMTQALLAAELLGQYVARNARPADNWLAKFDRERERLLRDYRRVTAVVIWLAQNPAFLLTALEVTHLLPRLFSHFLGVAGDCSCSIRNFCSNCHLSRPSANRILQLNLPSNCPLGFCVSSNRSQR